MPNTKAKIQYRVNQMRGLSVLIPILTEALVACRCM